MSQRDQDEKEAREILEELYPERNIDNGLSALDYPDVIALMSMCFAAERSRWHALIDGAKITASKEFDDLRAQLAAKDARIAELERELCLAGKLLESLRFIQADLSRFPLAASLATKAGKELK